MYLLGFVVLLFIALLFVPRKEGYMDSDLVSIQNDVIKQKTLLDKLVKSLNVILEKDVADKLDVDPLSLNIINKLKTLIDKRTPENVPLIEELMKLKEKTESLQPLINEYRKKIKELSETKVNSFTMADVLPETQKRMEDIKKDIERILKD
jgi:chromosome condensin MukBEF ATPase and DNA-binding subunit MukB